MTGLPSEWDKRGNIVRYTGIAFNNTKWEKMARELKEMKKRAELSDRLKSAFLANMSHEIRTPLNAIVGFSELLIDSDDPEERAECGRMIESNKLCDELYRMMLQKIPNVDVKLLQDKSLQDYWVLLDRDRLKQVWMNFLTNAMKCTRSGYIRMGFSVENGGFRFYVEDTGCGIPKKLHSQVFGRFQKLNEFTQGAGLGLAISKAIIEAAGGEIGFTSEPGVGSTFGG